MAFIKKSKSLPVISLTERVIQDILGQFDDHKKRYDVMIPRCMTQIDSEADLLGIRKSGFSDEFEIKLSRIDFLRDRKKIVKYRESKITEGNDQDLFCSKPTERSEFAPWEKLKLEHVGRAISLVYGRV